MGTNPRTEEEIEAVLRENHNEIVGHLGIQKAYRRIKKTTKYPDSWKE
jgi:hypothetical protein